jgi:subtilisin family serine protease
MLDRKSFNSNFSSFCSIISAVVLVAGCAGGGGGSSGSTASRTPQYTSASDFQTAEYNAQSGLAQVKASNMYYNGYSRYYNQNGGSGGNPSDSRAGTGYGVKIAVYDTGINATEASTGSQISIDAANSFNYISNTTGSSSDDNGHGTHVAGIIAAPKNDSGMHGIAFNATLVNFKMLDSTGSASTLTDGVWANFSTRAKNADAWISSNSWGSSTSITSVTTTQLETSLPNTIAAYRDYVTRGGVVVWAAGNSYANQPSYQAGMPYRVSGLESGWLSVMSVDPNGNETLYTNRCGVAKAWCLAAPGGGDNQAVDGIYSMYNDGSYTRKSGTSMAAPMVSGAIAGLKSMFPNLTYQNIRDRLLVTANKSGQYANQDIYGQGLMDLNAASSPVGGLSLPTSSHAAGSVASVTSSQIVLPSSLASVMKGQKVMVVDNYQKAPFYISASNFVKEAPSINNFGVRHLAGLSVPLSDERVGDEGFGFSSISGVSNSLSYKSGQHRSSFTSGFNSEQPMMRQLGFSHLPHLNESNTVTNGFGYASHFDGGYKFGAVGSVPHTQGLYQINNLQDARQTMGGRNAFSLLAQKDTNDWSLGANYSYGSGFNQPLGIAGSGGAFGINGTSATSVGTFAKKTFLSGQTGIKLSAEYSTFNMDAAGLTSFNNGTYSVLRLDAHHFLGRKTLLSLSVKQEQALSGQMNVRLPSSIDENGNISYANYGTGFGSLLNSNVATIDLHHRFSASKRVRFGLMYEAKPFGVNNAGAAGYYEHRF